MAEASLVQQAYTTIQKHFIETGRAPHFVELAATLGITPDKAREVQRAAAEASIGCWISHDTDNIGSWAPFSNIPTQYLVTVDGQQKWYGQ
jgi:DNA-directed RNA polymerase specialized sigma subunit